MKNKQLTKRARFLRQLNTPVALGLLAITQAIILLLLLLNLLKSPLIVTETSQTKIPVTLSFAVPLLEKDNWQPLVDEFESQNPDIRLKVVPGSDVTDELKAAYTTEFKNADAKQANASYDLIYTDIVWVAEFAKAGWLKELPPARFPKNQLGLFLPGEVEAGQYQGKLYRLPFRTDVGLLYYRKDLLKEVGYDPPNTVPTTFEDLLTASRYLQTNQRVNWGFVWQGQQYEGLVVTFFEVLQGFGGFWINPSQTSPFQIVGLDQPQAVAAAQFLQRTITEGISPEDVTTFGELEAIEPFRQKQAAFLRSWPNAWTQLQPGSLLQSQVGVMPMVHAPGVTGRACRGGWGFAIANRSRYPDAAFRAIQFFASEAAQRQFILKDSYVPTIEKLFNDPEIVKRYPYFPELISSIKNSASRPAIPEYEKVSGILQDYLGRMLRGQLSPEAAMQAAAKETRAILKA
jgi:multiple sugar transport system substrate-binding protein